MSSALVIALTSVSSPVHRYGSRSITVQRAYVLAFFDRHLRDGNGHLLAGPSRRYPEMRLTP